VRKRKSDCENEPRRKKRKRKIEKETVEDDMWAAAGVCVGNVEDRDERRTRTADSTNSLEEGEEEEESFDIS